MAIDESNARGGAEIPVKDFDAFLAPILADPDEDLHRLALADYLQDDDRREWGEFIHVQCELARLEANTDLAEDGWPRFGHYADPGVMRGAWECAACAPFTRLRGRQNALWEAVAESYPVPAGFGFVGIDPRRREDFPSQTFGLVRRGFVEKFAGPASAWIGCGDDILKSAPVVEVALETWPTGRWVHRDEGNATGASGGEWLFIAPDAGVTPLHSSFALLSPGRLERELERRWPKVRRWVLPGAAAAWLGPPAAGPTRRGG